MRNLTLATIVALGVSTAAFAGEGTYVTGGFGDVQPRSGSGSSQSSLNIGVGQDYGYVRTEASFRNLKSGAATRRVDGNIGSLEGFVQCTQNKFTPFVGGGVGFTELNGPGVVGHRDGIAYIGTAGLSYEFSKEWSGSVQYNYLKAAVNVQDLNGAKSGYVANDIGVNVRYTF